MGPNDGFDADVLVNLSPQPGWQPKDYIENLYDAFRGSGTYKDLVREKTRCVRIKYANEFHIDLVPYIEISGVQCITNHLEPQATGRYELSNPEAFTAWIAEREQVTNGTFSRTVRLIKYLRDYKNTFTCKSIILLTLLGQQVDLAAPHADPEKYCDLPTTLNELLQTLASALPHKMPVILAPDGSGDDLAARYQETWDYARFRSMIQTYAGWVRVAYEATDRGTAITAWQRVFGEEFAPDAVTKLTVLVPYRAEVPWSGERFIDKPPYNYPIRLDPHASVRIQGKALPENGFRSFDLKSHGYQVSPRRKLRFEAKPIGVVPDEIYWKVRNGGPAAAAENGLRGEITKDGGRRSKDEPTRYPGRHYVECYVIKDRTVVAKTRHPVIITAR